MKNERYYTIRTVPTFNGKIVDIEWNPKTSTVGRVQTDANQYPNTLDPIICLLCVYISFLFIFFWHTEKKIKRINKKEI